jgi:MFS family permease
MKQRTGVALAILFAINMMNFFDRQILGAVGEQIRKEWQLSDTALGTLGTAFTLIYAIVGLPLGGLADKVSRVKVLSVGVTVWSCSRPRRARAPASRSCSSCAWAWAWAKRRARPRRPR